MIMMCVLKLNVISWDHPDHKWQEPSTIDLEKHWQNIAAPWNQSAVPSGLVHHSKSLLPCLVRAATFLLLGVFEAPGRMNGNDANYIIWRHHITNPTNSLMCHDSFTHCWYLNRTSSLSSSSQNRTIQGLLNGLLHVGLHFGWRREDRFPSPTAHLLLGSTKDEGRYLSSLSPFK